MQLTNRKKVVSKKEMSLVREVVYTSNHEWHGNYIKTFFKKGATIRYPEVKREISETYRGQHVLKRDDQGAERCTACGLCAVACPAEAITMEAAERKKGEEIYTEKKNMLPFMKSICFVAFSAVCVKKLVRKKPFSLPTELFQRI
jgi:NADH-quinone oxidoreductase subunit I